MTIITKEYNNYQEYLIHQKSKAKVGTELRNKLLTTLWEDDYQGFILNFKPYKKLIGRCKQGICLGARVGQEIHALKTLGLDNVIGIDLIPHAPFIIEGDVHCLPFINSSFDFIFSNIFDHVLMPMQFISEIERVSTSGALCILHLEMQARADLYAANILDDPNDVIQLFKKDIDIIVNKRLNQANWPDFWELVIRIK
jgi:hypothetical protein